MTASAAHPPVLGLLLAGGQSRRMGGGDKCLRELAGRPILSHVIDRIRPQVQGLLLNANGDPERFAEFGLPIVADSLPDFAGPLAGVLAGLDWASVHAPELAWVMSVPTDAPFLPHDLARRLFHACDGHRADMACAASNDRPHPVVGLWPVRLRHNLRRALAEDGIRKVDAWTAQYRLATVEFPADPVDPFFNANRPEDLAEAERLLEAE
jgi:molybdopterin-guanine dinucleotide biosynthesis protein A